MKMLFLIFCLVLGIGAPPLVETEAAIHHKQEFPFHEFARALHHKDTAKLHSLIEPSVKIPEIRENSPIMGLETMPSLSKHTYIMIGSFRDDCAGYPGGCERTAFIWQVSVKGNKISKIKVLSDLANPYMNETIITKEYKEKFNKEILVPAHFPFKMTHVDGKISGEKIVLRYQNRQVPGVLEIIAAPTSDEIVLPKGNMYRQKTFKKKYSGFIGRTTKGHEVIFIRDHMQYNVRLTGASKKELILVVNSMLPISDAKNSFQKSKTNRMTPETI